MTVRFPSMFRSRTGPQVVISDPVTDIPSLLAALEAQFPGLSAALADPIYNFAVNDEMLLHGVNAHSLVDGDVVEIVPTIAGG